MITITCHSVLPAIDMPDIREILVLLFYIELPILALILSEMNITPRSPPIRAVPYNNGNVHTDIELEPIEECFQPENYE